MDLFLLLSLGMSIISLISVALNQAPVSSPIVPRNFESTFPLEAYLLGTNQINTLKLEDQVIAIETSAQLIDSIDVATDQAMPLLVASEY